MRLNLDVSPQKIIKIKLKIYFGRKYIFYIIIFIITYTLLCLSKLDELDRKNLFVLLYKESL